MTKEEQVKLMLEDLNTYMDHVSVGEGFWLQIADGMAQRTKWKRDKSRPSDKRPPRNTP